MNIVDIGKYVKDFYEKNNYPDFPAEMQRVEALLYFFMQYLAETPDSEMLLTHEEIQFIITEGCVKYPTLKPPKYRQAVDRDIAKAQLLKATPIIRAKTAKEIFDKLGPNP